MDIYYYALKWYLRTKNENAAITFFMKASFKPSHVIKMLAYMQEIMQLISRTILNIKWTWFSCSYKFL